MTFSLIGLDSKRRFMVVAAATKTEAVGSSVPAIRPRVGGVVSQSFTNPELRGLCLDAIAAGEASDAAIRAALDTDPNPELRQLAVMNADGQAAVHTGHRCSEVVGEFVTENFVALGNLLKSKAVIQEMAAAWNSPEGLSELLIAALNCMTAAEAAGGDSRGRQSASLLVADMVNGVELADLRIDNHTDPLNELIKAVNDWAEARAPSA